MAWYEYVAITAVGLLLAFFCFGGIWLVWCKGEDKQINVLQRPQEPEQPKPCRGSVFQE